MKLSLKMILLFSVIIAAGLLILSSYAVQLSVSGANDYTEARFSNMSESIVRYLEQDIGMMRLTMTELTDDLTFMSAVNQYVRDDSSDQKMADRARIAALQQLYQSPLVDQFYSVCFFNRSGSYFTSRMDENGQPLPSDERIFSDPATLELLDELEPTSDYVILAPHVDSFTPGQNITVYGIAQRIQYKGSLLGAVVILNENSELDNIMGFVDTTDMVEVYAAFDSGALFYSSTDAGHTFPTDIPLGEMQLYTEPETGTQFNVLHTHIDSLGLHLFIAQNSQVTTDRNQNIRLSIVQRTLLVMIPAIFLIVLFSYALTRSIRKLTKKVGQMPVEGVLQSAYDPSPALMTTVTSSHDQEIRELEQTYNHMMLRLRDSTLNELAMREGTLQAQLNALQMQINPHFIYNTLNIISAKSMESGNLDVIEICDQFASMLRYATDTRSRTAFLQEEIENVRNYLLLAKSRYEDNLEFVIDVPEDLHGIEVPKLTLQPLVENALNHGYAGSSTLRRISVIGTITDSMLVLEIRDNGAGFSGDMLRSFRRLIADIDAGKVSIEDAGGHIGLINTCLRLHYYSNGAMRMTIRNDNGAVVTLTMPVEQSALSE